MIADIRITAMKSFFVYLYLLLLCGNTWGYSKIDHDDKIDMELFQSQILENNVTSLYGALELVPEDFYSRYVLMYRSRSLQESNYLYPRAIVFGQSARFIMALCPS